MNTPDPSTTVLSDEYDPTTDEPLTVRVVRSVAVVSDREPLNMPPLGETVNTDGLESLIDASITDRAARLAVVFEYGGYLVYIDDQGTLTIHEDVE